jgi:LPXTG-motif cell wall-anchored protein
MAFCHPSRLVGLAMAASAVLLFQQSPASAAFVDGNPGARDPDRFEHITDDMKCAGSSAVKYVDFRVNGEPVAELAGNMTPESKVVATFELTAGCSDTKVGLATYNAVTQKMMEQQTGTFSAGVAYSLAVSTSKCTFQINLFTGELLNQLNANVNYSTPVNNLIATANGGSKSCDVAPVEASGNVTTTTSALGTTSTTAAVRPSVTSSSTTTSTVTSSPPQGDDDVEVASTSISRESTTTTAGATQPVSEQLPHTGSNTATMSAIGLALVVVGGLLTAFAMYRKRRN